MEKLKRRNAVDCSVLMPVLNEEAHIASSVDSMRRQRFCGTLEFIVVDGGSVDGTRQILERLAKQDSRIRLFDNPGGITPSGLNIALRQARGQWVARMDAHTIYPDSYLADGVERLKRGDTRWVSGPPIPAGAGPVSRAVTLALRSPLGRGASRKWASAPGESAPEYDLDSGVFAGVWERSTVLEYGGWDERWPRNQDSELAGRFLARGERLVCLPSLAAYYTPRDSLPGLWRQYLEYGRFRERTAVRHPDTMRRSHLLAPGVVVTLAAAVLAPRRLRWLARRGLAAYGTLLVVAGADSARQAEHPVDAALVPVVLATMHLAHGTGALREAARHGPPLAALASVLGLRSLAARLARGAEAVYAPSLGEARGHSD
jgi:succinoglycan biosynthesis protein ExoA